MKRSVSIMLTILTLLTLTACAAPHTAEKKLDAITQTVSHWKILDYLLDNWGKDEVLKYLYETIPDDYAAIYLSADPSPAQASSQYPLSTSLPPQPPSVQPPLPSSSPSPSPRIEQMVWIPRTGQRYHSKSSCSNMKNPQHVTITEARDLGYTKCSRC